jgi:hypothetical protein
MNVYKMHLICKVCSMRNLVMVEHEGDEKHLKCYNCNTSLNGSTPLHSTALDSEGEDYKWMLVDCDSIWVPTLNRCEDGTVKEKTNAFSGPSINDENETCYFCGRETVILFHSRKRYCPKCKK